MKRLEWVRPLHLAILAPWLVVASAAFRPIKDNSFLWHVRAGTAQIESQAVLTRDIFTWTAAERPWRTQSWLAELAYAWLEDLTGLAFVPWMIALAAGVTVLAAMAIGRACGAGVFGITLIGVTVAWVGASFFNPRPALLSFVLFALAVLASNKRTLYWTFPLIAWIWAGVHASFPILVVFLVCEGLRRRQRELTRSAAACVVAVLFTAHGWGIAQFGLDFARGSEALELLSEWRTPSLVSLAFLPILTVILGLIAAAIVGRLNMADLWLVAPALVLVSSSARSVFPGLMLLLPLLGRLVRGDPLRPRLGSETLRRAEATVLVAAGLAITLAPVAVSSGATGLDPAVFPLEAVQHLTAERVFADDVRSGYLIYVQWPDQLVYVDDRAELHGVERFAEALAVRNGQPVWRDVFEREGISQALIRSDDGLRLALDREGWSVRFAGGAFVVMDTP